MFGKLFSKKEKPEERSLPRIELSTISIMGTFKSNHQCELTNKWKLCRDYEIFYKVSRNGKECWKREIFRIARSLSRNPARLEGHLSLKEYRCEF